MRGNLQSYARSHGTRGPAATPRRGWLDGEGSGGPVRYCVQRFVRRTASSRKRRGWQCCFSTNLCEVECRGTEPVRTRAAPAIAVIPRCTFSFGGAAWLEDHLVIRVAMSFSGHLLCFPIHPPVVCQRHVAHHRAVGVGPLRKRQVYDHDQNCNMPNRTRDRLGVVLPHFRAPNVVSEPLPSADQHRSVVDHNRVPTNCGTRLVPALEKATGALRRLCVGV